MSGYRSGSRLAVACAVALAGSVIGVSSLHAQTDDPPEPTSLQPFELRAFDSDDDSVPSFDAGGSVFYADFAGQPTRVNLADSVNPATSEVSAAFANGTLSGPYSFVDDGQSSTFSRITRSGGDTAIDRLPWVEPGSNVIAADAFGRYVIPDAVPGTIHDTLTGSVWQPLRQFGATAPAGPNSLSADGNTAVFIELGQRGFPGMVVYTRSTGAIHPLDVGSPDSDREAAISANARYVVAQLDGVGVRRFDLLTGSSSTLIFFEDFLEPIELSGDFPTQLAVGNDGQVFWVANGHGYRWLGNDFDLDPAGVSQIDVNSVGESADAAIETLKISASGQQVLFTSSATNLVPQDGSTVSGGTQTFHGTAIGGSGRVWAPSNVDAEGVHPKMADVSWTASRSSQVIGYSVLRNGVEITQVLGTEASLLGLPSGSSYLQVRALALSTGGDGSVVRSVKTSPVRIRTDYDSTRPTTPTDLAASVDPDPRQGGITLNWTASLDNSNVVRYAVYDRNELITMVDTNTAFFAFPPGSHYFQVRAIDLNGNHSVKTPPIFVET